MNKEAQRVAIAKACGWKQDKNGLWYYLSNTENRVLFEPPDYLNDLNAMHEAEKKFLYSVKLTDDYVNHLTRINKYCTPWHVAASQRCEAFLKTLGLWKE